MVKLADDDTWAR